MAVVPPSVRAQLAELRSDYFFCVDNKLWDELIDLFTPNATFRGTGFGAEGPVEFVEKAAEIMTGVHSSHFGFQPVFSIDTSGTAARGRWAMQDFLTWDPAQTSLPGITTPGAHSLHGFGYYEDAYALGEGGWRISSMRLIRTRIDVSHGEPRPSVQSTEGRIDTAWAGPR